MYYRLAAQDLHPEYIHPRIERLGPSAYFLTCDRVRPQCVVPALLLLIPLILLLPFHS
ncbi:hypothetical protein EDB85DRAFT_1871201 [Lactarius pseudohatsudake]|nr:hypothetical protein EDB85DRAFT_1874315 [Lactarius pseudohatsudake]KAH9022779.1 hypothetical protein EDB85DRAFT_1871201 [Lactarius pseudohatsudake]